MSYYARHRYAILFCTLLATIAIGPLLEEFGFDARVIEVFLAANLLAAMVPFSQSRRRYLLYALVALALSSRYATESMGLGKASSASLVLWTVVAAIAAVRAVRFSLSSVKVDAEHLCAALSAYLLTGVFLGVTYVAVEHFAPGSILSAGEPDPTFTLTDAIYFSFVTLATLGYGDVLPASAIARGIAVFEAIFGQLFLAVMVARLVSLRIASIGEELTETPARSD